MRYPASEKLEIIRLVEQSHLPAKRTLEMLGVPKTTFYRWYERYRAFGEAGLEDRRPRDTLANGQRQPVVEACFLERPLCPDRAGANATVFRRLAVDGRRVLVLIPDGTRTMPMPLAFDMLERALGPRVKALDFLVALGTHPPLSDERLARLVGREVADGRAGERRVSNHLWGDPETFVTLGTIPAREIEDLTGGRLRQDVPVALNRLILDYDHILICGPVFPHEVVGFSGGTKYLFPGIAGAEHAVHEGETDRLDRHG